MLQFEKEMVITGAEQRVKKDNTSYTLVHVLLGNATTCSCVSTYRQFKLYRIFF